ncbi:MAG: nucleotidyltransferase domain-containing protein, partial [Nanoarchaeota archaeon]
VNGINLSQSEKNRLSRDIRKKFQFIKEASNFKDEFDLKKSNLINLMIKEVKEVILENPLRNKIKKIILFGSVVENKLTIKSDIDIAVEFSEITKKQAFDFRKNILGKVSDKLDIQIFNFLPEKIKNSILKKYKILYKNE